MSLATTHPRRGRKPAARLPMVGLLLLSFLASCQSAPKQDPAAIRSAIEAVGRQVTETFANKDGSAMSLFYTEDAIALPPGSAPVVGRPAIEAMWKSMLSLPLAAFELRTSEIGVGPETTWEMGHYRLVQSDGSTADTGQYIVIWKETAAGWKVYREIWNSDVPTGTPAAETPASPSGQ